MTAAITVGFQPATAPVIGAPAAATPAAGQPAAEGGLFAALLALLAPGAGPSDITLPDAVAKPLQGLAQAKDLLPEDLEAQLSATAGKLGIDLASLGDLLAGLDTAPETPIDPEAFVDAVTGLVEALAAMADTPVQADTAESATDEQLEAAVDALLALVGVTPPPPAPAPTTAETFTELVGERTEALTGPVAPSTDAPATAVPTLAGDGDTMEAAAATGAAAPTSSTKSGTDAAVEPATDNTRAPLVERLTQLLDDTAKAMATANPQLADKLTALAKALPTLPDEVLTALEATTAGTVDDAAPELASLIDQAARPRPAQRTASTPAFAAPRLDLPASDADAGVAPVAEPKLTPKSPALDSADIESAPAAPNTARPDRPATAPAGNQPTPAAAPAETATDKPADLTQAPTAATTAPQPPAAAPAAIRTVQAAYQQPSTPIPLPQVAFEIVRQVQAGNSRFQIRLDPADLGRIDVQLDVDRSGNVSARMVVERPETLDLMQRDQRALQQALQQAGLDANRTSLEFSLRQNPFAGEGSGDGRNQRQSGQQGGGMLTADPGNDTVPEIYRGSATPGALNLFV